MSSEQPEVETPTALTVTANSQADITQQATTPTPTTHVKNPKRVAAGKRVAERTRIAREQQKKAAAEASVIITRDREQQKKAAAEASVIIANNKAKATAPAPEPAPTTEVENPKNSGLSVNQWISIGGIAVSFAGIYYKREELKAAFSKKKTRLSPRQPVLSPRQREKV